MVSMNDILLVNGPNLNLLGTREKEIYGDISLQLINKKVEEICKQSSYTLECFQSNSEEKIIEKIHENNKCRFILINPAAYTHTSIAIRDAILAINTPFIEIHLSNPNSRESFRKKSFFSDIAYGVICGFGEESYELGARAAVNYMNNQISGRKL